MISHMTQITRHGFHACDSFELMIWFIGLDREKRTCVVDLQESADGFRTMTNYESWGLC